MRSARRSAAISISGRLIDVMCMPVSTQGAKKMLSRLDDEHIAMSAPFDRVFRLVDGLTSTPSVSVISAANASRFSRVGLKQRICLMSRTAQAAISCEPACQPEPRMPTVLGVLAREILDAEPVGGADAHALHHAVGHDRERLAVVDREQQHQADPAVAGRRRHLLAHDRVAALGKPSRCRS